MLLLEKWFFRLNFIWMWRIVIIFQVISFVLIQVHLLRFSEFYFEKIVEFELNDTVNFRKKRLKLNIVKWRW